MNGYYAKRYAARVTYIDGDVVDSTFWRASRARSWIEGFDERDPEGWAKMEVWKTDSIGRPTRLVYRAERGASS